MAFPIHNHTEYSALDGLSRPIEIAERCKAVGFDGAACTDHGLVSAHIDFYETMAEEGLKPLLGLEAYQARDNRRVEKRESFHLILLAKNDVGLRNLWALSTESHRTGFYFYPRVDWELLEERAEGLIATSACLSSLLSVSLLQDIQGDLGGERLKKLPDEPLPDPNVLLDRYLKIFGENFFVELHTYDSEAQSLLNVALVELAQSRGLPLVYANDAHYAFPEQHELHEATMALQMRNKLADEDRMSHPRCLYIMSEEEVRERLIYLPTSAVDEALKNSDWIAETCNVTLPVRRHRIPVFIPEKRFGDPLSMLIELSLEGFSQKIQEPSDIYRERLESELTIIIEADLVNYFLIVSDFVREAKRRGIFVGPGRGSVGGSLVAYCLGITDIDPIRYDLIFERFYNTGRAGSMPDIDTDFQDDRRDEIKEYVVEKYGEKYVADLTTITRMQAKAAIRDLGRVLSVSLMDCNKICDIIDRTIDAGISADWDEINTLVGHDLKEWREQYPLLFEWAEKLFDYVRTYGVHPSAVLIGDEPLDYTYPLRWAAKPKRMVSQWDMGIAEKLGFLKMDFLGLRNLTTLAEMNRILESRGKPLIDFSQIQYQDHDEAMWLILEEGLTVGLFQVESGSTAKQIARDLRPRSIDDLALLVAMNRPGPLRSGAFNQYLKGRHGEKVDYSHPILKDILADTYGVFVYQEQVIRYMTAIGYTLSEADEVRAIMGKKKVEKLDAEHDRYLDRAQKYMDVETAEKIWGDIYNFAKYGFNKSHAVGYGMILLWTLAAKYYAPAEFLLAGIRTVNKEDKSLWVNEAIRMGIEILPPDVNRSEIVTELVDDTILYGLSDVKGMGQSHSRWIVENRPFSSVEEFVVKTQQEDLKYTLPTGVRRIVVDKGRIKTLLRIGAFAALGVPPSIDEDGELRLLSQEELVEAEEELLGVALSDDSTQRFEQHKDLIRDCVPLSKALSHPNGKFHVAGIVRQVRKRKTKDGKPMAFVKIGLDAEETEFAVWQEVLRKRGKVLTERKPVYCHLEKSKFGLAALDVMLLD